MVDKIPSKLYHTSFSYNFQFNPDFNNKFYMPNFITELRFEDVRKKEFSGKPSRLNGIFAYRTIEEARNEGLDIYEIQLIKEPNIHYADSLVWAEANSRMMVFLKWYDKEIEKRSVSNKEDLDIQELLGKTRSDKSFSEIIDSFAEDYWTSRIQTEEVEVLIDPNSIESLVHFELPSKKRSLF